MEAGVIVPHRILGKDPTALRDFSQGVEDLGFSHLLTYDHVLGAGLASRPDWSAPYSVADPFHEAFVMFGFLAGVTRRLEFTTGIMVLPQRQTALVAKQAAEVALLSGGRLRLGVGIGWNRVEYDSLSVPWERRVGRYEEQIRLLRRLWSEETVTHASDFHTLEDVGINPRTSPVPLWLGSGAGEPALRRVARLGDGWVPVQRTGAEAQPAIDRLRELYAEAGRDPAGLRIQARLILRDHPRERWAAEAESWRRAGATHLALGIHGLPLAGVEACLQLLEAVGPDVHA